jgi:transcription-repair coupling factor (superfamily II helicase)
MTDPVLRSLVTAVRAEPVLSALLGADDVVVAVPEAAQPFVLASLVELTGAPVVVVALPTGAQAERFAHDIGAYIGQDRVLFFPAWETLPFERISPSVETMGTRLRVLAMLQSIHTDDASRSTDAPVVVVAPIKALLQRLGTSSAQIASLSLRRGDEVDLDRLVSWLSSSGYRREYQVEHRGEFAVRGGILDVFPSLGESGIRIDCFGATIERLTELDVATQRSVGDLHDVEIFGCRELVIGEAQIARARELSRIRGFAWDRFERIANGEVFDGIESFLPWLNQDERLLTDTLGRGDRIVLIEPRRIKDRASELLEEEAALASSLSLTWGIASDEEASSDETGGVPRLHVAFDRLLAHCGAHLCSLVSVASGPEMQSIQATSWPRVVGDPALLSLRLGGYARNGFSVVVCCETEQAARRVHSTLEEAGCALDFVEDDASRAQDGSRVVDKGVHVVVASIDSGFVLSSAKIAILAESDLTGRHRPHRTPKTRTRSVEGFFDDLAPGSYVVHRVHGVARFDGMVKRAIGGSERDYLLLSYRGDDKLYVPSDQIDVITPYSGGEQPSLSRLGGGEWQKQRARVRQAVRAVAQELVVLYQRRMQAPGHAFAPDSPWQSELEQAFPYPETPDQLRAIAEVKGDMERPVPMDRLVCGDVGFGKTEVALRAVFKAVQDNKQAAVLVPTTLLASQHFQTFSERLSPYPLRVEMLSRFLTSAQARNVTEGLSSGSVDVVIGTHKMLTENVKFADLGLLVIDEEQRFGVTHKESLKRVAIGVDILTMSANPIPRTLEMGLTGIRDLSIIDTPPASRQPILTYVGEEDDHAIAEAIRRELLREGQVFFVHNRVRDIERIAGHVRELVPEARVAVAHGQMDEGSLEDIVFEFSEGRYDVLVCTTIIESGIDMPTVNTLVVDRADLLGLGQLHQLRGRVGRAGSRAYAYLFHPRDRSLTEQAYERLRTIGEHTELGSGFKIAMRDLEIRGAGSLLGEDQSGHIAAVGYDLYVKMVAEAVAELKGEEPTPPTEVTLDLPVEAYLPTNYVGREDVRLEAYRRLASVRQDAEVQDISAEWLDRFGPLPRPASMLLDVARLRALCVEHGIKEVSIVRPRPGQAGPHRPGEVIARISPLRLVASDQVRLQRIAPRSVYKSDLSLLVATLPDSEDLAAGTVRFLGTLLGKHVPMPKDDPQLASPPARS